TKMPGSSWLKAPRTPPFRPGIHRAQQFVHLAWLTPLEAGYSRAIPLRFLPAFPGKAVAAEAAPCKEWAAGLAGVGWVRRQLDAAGRRSQALLLLADGRYDTLGFWNGLPQRVVAAVRTSRHRVLYELPPAGSHKNRKYGAAAPKPAAWLPVRTGWSHTEVPVRGHLRTMRYRLAGPYRRKGAAQQPLFLLVVKGETYQKGKRQPKVKHRKPAFYLLSAVWQDDAWRLPLPVTTLLPWLWQRWELEVAHREMKSGFGVGEKQCWTQRSAIVSVQWSVWVYACLLLAGYRTWGLCHAPVTKTAWWPGAQRWSFNTLWRNYRAALWGHRHFRALYTRSSPHWPDQSHALLALDNAILAAARA
ncbi:MAG: transposase, partial [Candidatus Acidiferrales bacterium]